MQWTILNSVEPIFPGYLITSFGINSSLEELNSTKSIVVYVEWEFHDKKESANWIINNVKPIEKAICRGVCNYCEVTYKKDFSEKHALSL